MKRTFAIAVLMGIVCLLSCRKEQETEPRFKKGDVLMAGGPYSVGTDSGTTIYFLKNGVATAITNTELAVVTGMAVSGDDVYLSGMTSDMGKAACWKNGQRYPLESAHAGSIARSVFVAGNDVYVAGSATTTIMTSAAVYWKNGAILSAKQDFSPSDAYAIQVSGTDVYIGGCYYSGAMGDAFPVVWKNGAAGVPMAANSRFSAVSSMVISGSNVYAGGNFGDAQRSFSVATTWKNGTPSYLETTQSSVMQIAVSGNDVYAVGTSNAHGGATCWKNGVSIPLANVAPGSTANCIAIAGTDIYIGGRNNGTGVFWKNGVEYKQAGAKSINAIHVVQ